MKSYRLSIASAAIALPLLAGAQQWRSHTNFDEAVPDIFDTPSKTYFLARTQVYDANDPVASVKRHALFVYDKEADELSVYNRDNYLSEALVLKADYNAEKNYLLIVYTNHNIDILHDDGNVTNLPMLMASDVTGKDVNSITFDPVHSKAYLATDFGYLEIDDDRFEVSESRIYNTPVKSVAVVGDDIMLLTPEALLYAPKKDARLSLRDYREASAIAGAERILPLSESLFAVYSQLGTLSYIRTFENRAGGPQGVGDRWDTKVTNIAHNRDGYLIGTDTGMAQLRKDGTREERARDAGDEGFYIGSWDFSEVWYSKPRTGLCSKRHSGGSTTLTRDYMRPNAPAPFVASNMARHPELGMMVVNHGYDYNFPGTTLSDPILISTLDGGFWKNHGPAYEYPEQTDVLYNPNGLGIDPVDNTKLYFGSLISGLIRIDLENPQNILHVSRTSDPHRKLPGYVEFFPDMTGDGTWKSQCAVSPPYFDKNGNMWFAFHNQMQNKQKGVNIYCWTAADRIASTSPATFRAPKHISFNADTRVSNIELLFPLTGKGHENILVFFGNYNGDNLMVVDHAGTIDDTSDDRVVTMNNITNQEGKSVTCRRVLDFYEDPNTGLVWVAHANGVFTFDPLKALEGSTDVSFIKVPRNDGTNLADFLLNETRVNHISTDASGRKWFSTTGAGLVCTSSDGRTIMSEYTTANSDILDDNVYCTAYNARNNSMMVSTASGLCELFLSGSSFSGDDMSDVRVYPNPVRPDYYGYVTIDGLVENALVKIADAHGNIVKELGRAQSGSIQWDTTNLNARKVNSGVYHVLMSGPENSATSAVAKVLIVR